MHSGKGQQAQQAELLSGDTQAAAQLSAAQQWGKQGAGHLVHMLLTAL